MNIAPPKLKAQLLLAGMTMGEMAIMAILALAGFFSISILNAGFWPALWLLFSARLYRGKSIRTIVTILLKYHIMPQQFTRRVQTHEKARRNGIPHKIQTA